ncbi:hypothetical protein [Brachyspira pulli]|uniref:hypothetical protein n=1 Tax=Brachyspira pulli TaxID=310721 RepID=UPI0030063465
MNYVKESDFKLFVSRWINGIEFELNFWEGAIKDDKRWNSRLKIPKQTTSIFSPNIKKVLDVGSGPMTTIIPSNDIFIVATDPLADYYNSLLKKYNRTPSVTTEFAFSERLYEKYKENFFDEVYITNALDHSFFPMNSIYNMLYVLKTSGKLILKHFRNEAEIEKYIGFHQFNIDIQNNEAVLWNKNSKIVLNDILKNIATIKFNIEKVNYRKREEDYITIEITKNENFNILNYLDTNFYFDKYLFLEISKLVSKNANRLNIMYELTPNINNNEVKNTIQISTNTNYNTHFNNLNNNINIVKNNLNIINKKIDNIVNAIAWWIPVKKWRDNFRNKILSTAQHSTAQHSTAQHRD